MVRAPTAHTSRSRSSKHDVAHVTYCYPKVEEAETLDRRDDDRARRSTSSTMAPAAVGTLQDRLVSELRLRRITTVDARARPAVIRWPMSVVPKSVRPWFKLTEPAGKG